MYVALEDGTQLSSDVLLKAVQRFDLTPIPSTLELTLRIDASIAQALAFDSVVLAGQGSDRYRVVKVQRSPDRTAQQGQRPDVLVITAVLDGFSALAWPLTRAVVKERKTLGEVYRACGAQARIGDDIPIHLFTCFAGRLATESIAQLLQEEGAAPVWAEGRMSFKRLEDLFKGLPVDVIDADITQAVESPFLERQEVPWAMSTDAAGGVVLGRRDNPRVPVFLPRTPQRILNNMSRYLAVRRVMPGTYAGHIHAGDGLDIAGTRQVVVTVAHSWESGSGGQGANQVSRLWLGQLVR